MKIKLITILLAASLLTGCGSNLSKGNNEDLLTTEDVGGENDNTVDLMGSVDNAPEIQVIGIEEFQNAANSGDVEDSEDDWDYTADVASDMSDDEIAKLIEAYTPGSCSKRIMCWGDSLTEGTGGDGVSYPSVVADLTGCKVVNYGVYSERASLIAARQGASPQHVEQLSEIPATCTPVKVCVVGDNGNWEMWCNNGDAGVNPCIINGVEGTLSIDFNDGTRYFTRSAPGEAVPVNDGDEFIPSGSLDKKSDDILIIWSGSTDGWFEDRSIDDIIKYQKAMIKNAKCSEYVIINYTAKPNIGEEIDAWNERLMKEYGAHCLDVRSYLMEHGLEKAGIKPTDQDLQDIKSGQMPSSLRVDESHFNAAGYKIIGEQVFRKLIELGYLNN